MASILTTAMFGFVSMIFFKSHIAAVPGTKPKKSFYDIQISNLNGNKINLEQFRGKKVMIVNVASQCGFTPQYSSLQQLYEEYGKKIKIIAIPCNDFGMQEPGSSVQIKEFCSINYGITFPISSKQNIKSNPKSELYEWLSNPELNGWNNKLPSWNFCKYIINEAGELTHFFQSNVKPMSKDIISIL